MPIFPAISSRITVLAPLLSARQAVTCSHKSCTIAPITNRKKTLFSIQLLQLSFLSSLPPRLECLELWTGNVKFFRPFFFQRYLIHSHHLQLYVVQVQRTLRSVWDTVILYDSFDLNWRDEKKKKTFKSCFESKFNFVTHTVPVIYVDPEVIKAVHFLFLYKKGYIFNIKYNTIFCL